MKEKYLGALTTQGSSFWLPLELAFKVTGKKNWSEQGKEKKNGVLAKKKRKKELKKQMVAWKKEEGADGDVKQKRKKRKEWRNRCNQGRKKKKKIKTQMMATVGKEKVKEWNEK